jgi:hypothetical protein
MEINNNNNNDNIIKKKRGRKPLQKPEIQEEKVYKKRGRKPKGKIINYDNNIDTNISEKICTNIVTNLPIKLIDILDNNINNNEIIDESENIFIKNNDEMMSTTVDLFICNSPIKEKEKEKEKEKKYNCKCDEYVNKIKELNNIIENMTNKLNKNEMQIKERKVHYMNINFVKLNGTDYEFQEKTDVHCWWCCHSFDTMPCLLPEKYYDNKYYVFGCFCSYNCALAYNIDIDDYKTNERTTLLNYLYYEIYKLDTKLEIALPRTSLKIFGGPLTIEEYRKILITNNKEYKFIMPPMVCIIPLIEEDYKNTLYSKTKINSNIDINKYKYLSTNIKKNKIQINSNNLETTMKLIRK